MLAVVAVLLFLIQMQSPFEIVKPEGINPLGLFCLIWEYSFSDHVMQKLRVVNKPLYFVLCVTVFAQN